VEKSFFGFMEFTARSVRQLFGARKMIKHIFLTPRNKRIFYHKEASPSQLASSIQEAISLQQTAGIMPLQC
jgi:hypothetical protein